MPHNRAWRVPPYALRVTPASAWADQVMVPRSAVRSVTAGAGGDPIPSLTWFGETSSSTGAHGGGLGPAAGGGAAACVELGAGAVVVPAFPPEIAALVLTAANADGGGNC